jgi:predicted O-methyltransferase YrrM
MSEQTEPPTRALAQYVAAHALGDDSFLVDLRAAAREAGLPSIAIAAEQASFMAVLLQTHAARQVVEVGTLGGYSAISMARALPEGGRVRTIEVNAEHAAFARDWAARSDVAEKVEVLHGPGADVLPTFAADSADAAFLDADKVNYPVYLEECLRIVRPGGLILVDNAFAFGHLLDETNQDASVLAIRAFNDLVHAHPRLEGVIVPLGDGLWVTRVR